MNRDEEPEGVAHRVFVRHGWAVACFWLVIGLGSAVLLVLNLRTDGWDSGAVSNVLMIVSSCLGLFHLWFVRRHIT